jgi:arsenical pump membrane protein
MAMTNWAIWGISALATAGVMLRAFNLPEAVWAVAGAIALVCLGLLPMSSAFEGVGKGLDVYLFLAGMMLLAEIARGTGLFDWLAAQAASHARGPEESISYSTPRAVMPRLWVKAPARNSC